MQLGYSRANFFIRTNKATGPLNLCLRHASVEVTQRALNQPRHLWGNDRVNTAHICTH
ncbi:hypothetical protein D3C81_1194190 [compost metagenome]